MIEGLMCYSYKLNDTPKPCSVHCEFYEDGLACPFRTPREFWGEHGELNLCDFCQKKNHACYFLTTATTNRRTKNVVGCFGFKEVKRNENRK